MDFILGMDVKNMGVIGSMTEELLGLKCIIIPTQTMHLECIENYRKIHNGETPDCGRCPYNERIFVIVDYGVSKWGVEKVWLVGEEDHGKKFSIAIDNILLVNEEEE